MSKTKRRPASTEVAVTVPVVAEPVAVTVPVVASVAESMPVAEPVAAVTFSATDPLVVGGWNVADSDDSAIEAIKAAHANGEDVSAIGDRIKCGFVARRLAKLDGRATRDVTQDDVDAAELVLGMLGHGAKTKDSERARRTEVQEQAYAAARTSWSRLLKRAGVEATDPRGAKTKGRTKTKTSTEKETESVTTIPDAKTPAETFAFLDAELALLRAHRDRNPGGYTTGMRKLVDDFAAAIDAQKKEAAKAA